MVLLGAGSAIAALLGWLQAAMVGLALVLTGVVGILLLVFRRMGVLLRTLREHERHAMRRANECASRAELDRRATQALHADLLDLQGRVTSFERRVLVEVGSVEEAASEIGDGVVAKLDSVSSTLGTVWLRTEAARDSIEFVRSSQERAMTKLDKLRSSIRESQGASQGST